VNLAWLPSEIDTAAQAMQIYGANGWDIFPCIGKVPLTPNGLRDASHNAEQIVAWLKKYPNCNIGWALPVGLWALDIDPRHGGFESLRQLERDHGPLPHTLRQATGGGGEHRIFREPNGERVRQGAGFRPGLDTRVGGRGFLIVAPSVHPDTKKKYRWHTVAAPVEAPLWLMEMVKAPETAETARVEYVPPLTIHPAILSRRQRYAYATLSKLAAEVAAAPEGQRNHQLNKAWWRILQFRDAVPEEEARGALTQAASAAGLGAREIRQVLR
jgi:hypothetical protein